MESVSRTARSPLMESVGETARTLPLVFQVYQGWTALSGRKGEDADTLWRALPTMARWRNIGVHFDGGSQAVDGFTQGKWLAVN